MHDLPILTPAYTELVRGTLVNGTYSEMIQIQTDRQLAPPTPTPTLKRQKVQHERRLRKQQRRRYVAIHGRLHQLCMKLYDSRQTSLKKFFRDASRIYSPAAELL